MAKDPALLWYWNDWDGGTRTMNRHLKGCYMDLLSAQFNNGPLSLNEVKTILGNDFASWGALSKKFSGRTDDGLIFNERMEREKIKRRAYTESRRNSTLKNDDDDVKIFIIHDIDTDFYRIGCSKDPIRRFSDIINPKHYDISKGERNWELYWISTTYKRTVECEIQSMFLDKCVNNDWFSLTCDDFNILTKTYEGSYVKRTFFRTENENIDINIKKDIIKEKKDSIGSKSKKDTKVNHSDIDSLNVPFDNFWNMYGKKMGDRSKCEMMWKRLTDPERVMIIQTLPKFLSSIPDKQYQPYPGTYLNQRRWENELQIPEINGNFKGNNEKSGKLQQSNRAPEQGFNVTNWSRKVQPA
jgi:hypothetical protein